MTPSLYTRREFTEILAAAGAAGLLGCDRAGLAIDGVVVERDLVIPMRDGVALAADVHRPAQNGRPLPGPFPTVLERTPYGKHLPSRTERALGDLAPRSREEVAAMFVLTGIVVVYQDVRGRYASGGTFEKYVDDANDGYDTCAWLVQQPWCNGTIGTKGFSYAAHTQGALASMGAPGVAAMFVDSGAFSNSYQGGIRQGGAFELKQATWAYRNALVDPQITAEHELHQKLEAVDIHDWFRRMPWKPGHSPVSLAPTYEAYLFEQWTRGAFDEYWKRPGLWAQGYYDRFPKGPQVYVSSWYDPYPRTATENFMGVSTQSDHPVWLVLGPWTHGNRSQTFAGDVDFGPSATWDKNVSENYWDFRLRFFERYLLGRDNGFEQEPRVRYFVMGGGSGRRNANGRLDHGGRWRAATNWPVPGTENRDFYLHPDGGLRTNPSSDTGRFLSYRYDPRNPVPSIGGTITSGAPIMNGGAYDQRESPDFFGSNPPYEPLAARPDVLVFQTDPLERAVEITGPLTVVLWVSSDAPDTDFTAKLVDVYPPNEDYPEGFAMNITDGIIRMRYRDSWETPSLMKPGMLYRATIEAFPSSNLFARGHRIRLDISSSNFPHFDLNFNTGEAEGLATYARIATNRVWLDRDHASHAMLPVVAG